jgi:hypothetical protein
VERSHQWKRSGKLVGEADCGMLRIAEQWGAHGGVATLHTNTLRRVHAILAALGTNGARTARAGGDSCLRRGGIPSGSRVGLHLEPAEPDKRLWENMFIIRKVQSVLTPQIMFGRECESETEFDDADFSPAQCKCGEVSTEYLGARICPWGIRRWNGNMDPDEARKVANLGGIER